MLKALKEAGKSVEDFGNLRVSVSVPNTSDFDNDKVLEYVKSKGLIDRVTTPSLDEGKLMEAIENDVIDLEDLKLHAWVESTGSPRVSIKRIDKDESQ